MALRRASRCRLRGKKDRAKARGGELARDGENLRLRGLIRT